MPEKGSPPNNLHSLNLKKLLKNDKSILIIASRPLDLDCLGSGLILKKYLEHLDKNVRLFFPVEMTTQKKEQNRWLPYFDEIENKDTREILSQKNFDALFLIDGANLVQFYDSTETEANPPNLSIYDKRIHIDHHQNIEKLGTHTIHNPKVSSTAEIIFTKVIPGNFIDKKIATLGYAAIAGDTGNFRWNFYPSSLKLCGLLLEKGADPSVFLDKYFFSKTKFYFDMLAFAIQNTEYFDDIKTSFLWLPCEKLQAANIDEEKLEELKQAFRDELARTIVGYPRGIIFYEKEPGKLKISGRGNNLHNKISLPDLFAKLGGNRGGHFNAADFETEGNFKQMKESLIEAIKRHLVKT